VILTTSNLPGSCDSPTRCGVGLRAQRSAYRSGDGGSEVCQAYCPRSTVGKAAGSVKLATHLRLLPKSGIVKLHLPFPISPWRGAYLIKHRESFYVYPWIGGRVGLFPLPGIESRSCSPSPYRPSVLKGLLFADRPKFRALGGGALRGVQI
jgi:hypothetical protein